MITSLSAKNFKSWADTGSIRLAPITGLFGTNSSGKTSLLQLLLMLKQTADSPDRNQVLHLGDERSLVELGTFQDVAYLHDLTKDWEISLDWSLFEPLTVEDPSRKGAQLFQEATLGFSVHLKWQEGAGKDLGRAAVRDMQYRFAGSDFGMKPAGVKTNEFDLYDEPVLNFVFEA